MWGFVCIIFLGLLLALRCCILQYETPDPEPVFQLLCLPAMPGQGDDFTNVTMELPAGCA